MKISKYCCKCQSKDIRIVKALPIQIPTTIIGKRITPKYYICTKCGYCEIWFDNKEDLNYLSEKY